MATNVSREERKYIVVQLAATETARTTLREYVSDAVSRMNGEIIFSPSRFVVDVFIVRPCQVY